MSTLLRSALAGAGFAVISAGAALAYPASVMVDLNLRSGPGTGYGIVATMPAGAIVDVQNCLSNGWCQVSFSGGLGYASGNYLAGAQSQPGAVVVDSGPDYIAPEYYEYAYQYPPYWSNGSFYYWYGGNWRHVRRDRGWWDRHRGQFDRARRERPGINRPVDRRPDFNRPGNRRPGIDRSGRDGVNVIRPQPSRPEINRARPSRPDVNRLGARPSGVDRSSPNRPGVTRPRQPEGARGGDRRGGATPAVRGGGQRDGGAVRGGGGRGGSDRDNRDNRR